MVKRLTDEARKALEKKYASLKQTYALLDEGVVAKAVDGVSEEDADIAKVVEKIMSIMEAKDGFGKYHTASKKDLIALVKSAMDENEGPIEEANDMKNPVIHRVEDLEHLVQTMDDKSLQDEVEDIEQKIKDYLNHKDAEPKAEKEPAKEEASEDVKDKHEMNPEQKMAILMNLPMSVRAQKAANLRALANALEAETVPVSQDNYMHEEGNASLADHYEPEGMGSMEDVSEITAAEKAAALKQVAMEIIASMESMDKKSQDDKSQDDKSMDEESMAKKATLKFALKHLIASMESMDDEKCEECGKKDCECDDSQDDKSQDKKSMDDKSMDDKSMDDKSMETKRAILKARLASLRRQANVDGRDMKTPMEVPGTKETTEDQLMGDAKIQYSTATGDGNYEVHPKRQDVPRDTEMAGTEEPNAVFQSSKPMPPKEMATMEGGAVKSDPRILEDGQSATYSQHNDNGMVVGDAGTHQNAQEWAKVKEESDMTPSGDRLVGLAELNAIVAARTERAVKLASTMSSKGLIKTEAQLREQISKLASMDDDTFGKYAEFVGDIVKTAEEDKKDGHKPQWLIDAQMAAEKKEEAKKDKDGDESQDDKSQDDKSMEREARSIRRAGLVSDDSTRETGLRRPIVTANVDTGLKSTISSKLASMKWTDAVTASEKQANLDTFFKGGSLSDIENRILG